MVFKVNKSKCIIKPKKNEIIHKFSDHTKRVRFLMPCALTKNKAIMQKKFSK